MYQMISSLLLAAGVWCSLCGSADAWPDRAVHLILPVPAGSASDFTARLFAQRLSVRWAQPVVVENRPGADGIIGVASFVNLHDDHTLLFAISAVATVHAVQNENLPYNPVEDLLPIAPVSEIVLAIAASQKSGIRTLDDLVRSARAAPGKLNWASSPGLPPLVFGAFIKDMGLEMASIFYRDLAPAVQDLGEGRLDIYIHALSVLIPQAQSGRVRILAVASQQRAPAMPDIPSVTELGFAELSMEGLCGFFGSRGMAVAVRERVAEDAMAIAKEPDVQERLAAIGQAARPGTTAEFAAFLADNRKRLLVVARTAGVPTVHK
jgi:tripartite-type tricarboxylate transporter receptor subunit TctC